MKKLSIGAMLAISVIGLSAYAGDVGKLEVDNGSDDGVPVRPSPKGLFGGNSASAAPQTLTQTVRFYAGQDGVQIASLATLNSPALAQSRINAMAGMSGVAVPMDRTMNAAAWYVVPDTNQPDWSIGLQWFDPVGSAPPAKSWMGTFIPSGVTNDYGQRLALHCAGTFPVSAYTMTVTSSLTNIAATTFPVATNTSSGFENPASSTFVLGWKGPNGTNDSYYDLAQGKWIAGGDDEIYQNGELPSQLAHYDWWQRFGGTIQITVSSSAGYSNVISQFAAGDQYIYATLSTNGGSTVLASKYVRSARPKVTIPHGSGQYQVGVVGGQLNVPYAIWSTTNLNVSNTWTRYDDNHVVYSGGDPLVAQPTSEPQRYFRAFQYSP